MDRADGYSKRAPRVDLRRPAVMIDSDGRESRVLILDVSSGGFRLGVTESPRIGEFVTLRVERRDEFRAQIRWALERRLAAFSWTKPARRIGKLEGSLMAEDRRQTDDRRKAEDR